MASALARLVLAEGDADEAVRLLSGALAAQPLPADVPGLHRQLADAWQAAGRLDEACRASARAYDLLLERKLAHEDRTARALDVLHRTSALQRDSEVQRNRADALEVALTDLRTATERIHEMSIRDAVTGLHNRQFLLERAGSLVTGASSHRPVEVALIDLDRFKHINDIYGHAAGDRVLRRFADALAEATRPSDLVARYGGEEFVVMRGLHDDADTSLVAVLARVRRRLAAGVRDQDAGDGATGARATEPSSLRATFSAGVTRTVGEPVERVLHRADSLMYAAKRAGRDRVCADHGGRDAGVAQAVGDAADTGGRRSRQRRHGRRPGRGGAPTDVSRRPRRRARPGTVSSTRLIKQDDQAA